MDNRVNLVPLTEPLKDYFQVATFWLLHHGVANMSYIITETDDVIDGIFYRKEGVVTELVRDMKADILYGIIDDVDTVFNCGVDCLVLRKFKYEL